MFKLFGGFEAHRDAEIIPLKDFGRPKALKILKLLLINRGHVISNDQIIEYMFQDQDPEKASNNIQGRISELRKALEPELKQGKDSICILRNEHGYLITEAAPIETDLEKYLAAVSDGESAIKEDSWHDAILKFEEALALQTGELLEEDKYEDWAIEMCEHLRRKRAELMEIYADCYAHLGEYSKAVEIVDEWIQIDPFNERAVRAKLGYLYLKGEPKKAIQAYDRFVEALKSEWDESPAHETEEMRDLIEQGAVSFLDAKYPQKLTPELISRVPFFANLSKQEHEGIMEICRELRFDPGEFIIRKGDLGDSFYLVINGQVSVHFRDTVLKRGRGQYFGEMSLIDDWPRSADVKAHVTTRCLVLTREAFQDLVRKHPDIAFSMLKELSRRIREIDVGIEEEV